MKKIITIFILLSLVLSFASCQSGKGGTYTGKLGAYDATVKPEGKKMVLSFTITEKSSTMTVKNDVKIVGTVESSEKNKYVVNFADENTVISIKYTVTGKNADGYLESLANFLMEVVKTDADKALVEKLRLGEEVSFGIESALYTSLTGMPQTVTLKLYGNDHTFAILN